MIRIRTVLLCAAVAGAATTATASDVAIEVGKVPDSTKIEGRMAGAMAASLAQAAAVLCDYDGYPAFAKTTEAQAIVPADIAARLQQDPPEDPDDVEPDVLPGKVPPNCPNGENWVVSLQDFPFPVPDAWMLVRYRAEATAGELRIRYEGAAGTSVANGVWTVRATGPDTSELVHEYDFDMGMGMPEFLLRWASGKQLPAMFHAIEDLARQARPLAWPTPATAPATAAAPATAP